MGRRKITIKQIPDIKLRHITFNKRKNGLFKKAAELSVLCNLNLLLVCEDGLGNLIRFSKTKITDVNSFISQCNYQNIIDLTSEDYPDFAKINRKKDKDKDDVESYLEEEQTPQTKEQEPLLVAQSTSQHKVSGKTRQKSHVTVPVINEDRGGYRDIWKLGLTVNRSKRTRNKVVLNPSVENVMTQENGGPDSVQKKNKNKLNLRLKIPKQEGINEGQQTIVGNEAMRLPSTNVEQPSMYQERARKQSDNLSMRAGEKTLDFPSPSFLPFADSLKKMGGMYDPSTSPFKLYSQNRMDPLNTVLKGFSPFKFPAGTPILSRQGIGLGEGDDRYPDNPSAFKFVTRGGMGLETGNSATSNKVFTFQPEEPGFGMNQMSTRNDMLYGGQRALQNAGQMQAQMNDYMNLPSALKSEPDFDMNMPAEALSARRFNFDEHFKDFDDGSGYTELRKKYKLN